MQKCECSHETDIATIINDLKRWKPLMDGNGHESIGTRLSIIEKDIKELIKNYDKMQKTIDNQLETSEALKTSISAFAKTMEFKKEQEEKESKRNRNLFSQTFIIIMAGIAFASLIINLLKDIL